MKLRLPRLLLAAPASGGGKTTLTCGLLQAFQDQGKRVAACKCGPDYIDPLFHRQLAGAQSGNLDLFFTDEPTTRALLAKHSAGCDLALLEGVMGFYDGLALDTTEASSYHLAKATQTPVILVVNARGAALSLAATLRGFAALRTDANIQGVILNQCAAALYARLKPVLEAESGLSLLGYLPREPRFALESRHLGLVTAAEISGLRALLADLAQTLSETVDLAKLWRIAQGAPDLTYEPYRQQPVTTTRPRLAVARDEAFCFYYQENLAMLTELGAQLVPFSPLADAALPEGVDGVYLGGGYPELYAETLAANAGMRQSLREATAAGLPLVAECGGFLYLLRELTDPDGQSWPMAGLLAGGSRNEQRLKQFGYITLTAQRDNLYCETGASIRAHEFHYWQADAAGDAFLAAKPRQTLSWPTMVAADNLVAGFPHLYYPANPAFAANFVRALARYQENRS